MKKRKRVYKVTKAHYNAVHLLARKENGKKVLRDKEIAKIVGIGNSTVSAVRNAKTYKEYRTKMKERVDNNAKRSLTQKTNDQNPKPDNSLRQVLALEKIVQQLDKLCKAWETPKKRRFL